jgi:hypothetical protein
VVDITAPESPAIVGNVDTSNALNVAISGSYAYVADYDEGLRVILIATPQSPAIVGSVNTWYAHDVAISGSYAYVADATAGLKVVDVTVPQSPAIVGSVYGGGSAYGVAVSGDYAYIAAGGSDLQVVDISTPASPTIVGSIDSLQGAAFDVVLMGDYAYLASQSGGVQVVDITTPQSPRSAGGAPSEAHGVAVTGYIYAAGGASGLHILPTQCDAAVSVDFRSDGPHTTSLGKARPNPFGVSTTIPIHLDRAGRIDLVVYDVRGRRVRMLAADTFDAGTHFIEWNGRDGAGKNVSTGVYFVTLSAADEVTTREVIRLR